MLRIMSCLCSKHDVHPSVHPCVTLADCHHTRTIS